MVLSAMAGYTDLPYRLICRQLGAEYCTSEMMLDKSLLVGSKLRKRLAAISQDDHPVAGQLIGNSPDTMATAAAMLDEIGFDVVELNFACPVNKALRRRRGGYLMSCPDEALAIVRAVIAATARPVSLKLRRSFRATDDESNFWRIAEGGSAAGVSAITVHARSVEVKYSGPADWSFLADVREKLPDQTIIGSGDMLTPQAALDAMDELGLDGIAVARGALGNPWFFQQVKNILAGCCPEGPTLTEQRELLLRHFADTCGLYGPKRGPKMMRKFGIKYARLHPHPRRAREAFVDISSAEDWHAAVARLYQA